MKYNVLLDNSTPTTITVLAQDYRNEGEWVVFRDYFCRDIAVISTRKIVCIFIDLEDDDEEAEGTVE